MELNAAKKSSNEVVLVIPGEEAAPVSSKMASLEEHSKDPVALSPDIVKVSSSPRKPPKPPVPEGLSRRRSIPSSAFSKPKSRFVEQTVPQSSSSGEESRTVSQGSPFHGSPNHKAGGTPKTPVEEEDEEEEICKKGQLDNGGKKRWRLKVRILIEWSILVSSMGCLITSLLVHGLKNFVIWGLEIWKWCLMVIVICCGRLVTQWFITVLVFLIERNFLLRKKVLYFVYGLKNSVQDSGVYLSSICASDVVWASDDGISGEDWEGKEYRAVELEEYGESEKECRGGARSDRCCEASKDEPREGLSLDYEGAYQCD
ncbi:hypothetical protein J5N97_009421 [Dioscorea zingiberensis]|uniref:Uncharacterized protein n=1 Tax=Dioscorea zingiberensis TaxID=325984 RepID=A0A9D5HLY6_9LILI|nr:hypothetical protein J5N97_009421 [Dioscorea zingiberensis]